MPRKVKKQFPNFCIDHLLQVEADLEHSLKGPCFISVYKSIHWFIYQSGILYIKLQIYPLVYLSIWHSIHQTTNLSIGLSINLAFYTSIYKSIHWFIYQSGILYINLQIYQYIYQSISKFILYRRRPKTSLVLGLVLVVVTFLMMAHS